MFFFISVFMMRALLPIISYYIEKYCFIIISYHILFIFILFQFNYYNTVCKEEKNNNNVMISIIYRSCDNNNNNNN